jgi:hypothetical protein
MYISDNIKTPIKVSAKISTSAPTYIRTTRPIKRTANSVVILIAVFQLPP